MQITQGLDPERFERTLVATRGRKDAPFVAELEAGGVRVVQLARRGRLDLAAWRPLLAELRRTDVLHAHKFGSNVWAAAFGTLLRVPVVVTHEHTWSYVGQPLRRPRPRADRSPVERVRRRLARRRAEDGRDRARPAGQDPLPATASRRSLRRAART